MNFFGESQRRTRFSVVTLYQRIRVFPIQEFTELYCNMSTKRSSLTLVSRKTSPSTIKLLLLVSYGIVAMIGYGLGKVSEAAPAATCLSPLSAAAQPVCNCYCDGSHKARSSSSSLRVEEAEEEEQQQEGETPNETGGAEAPADEVAEPEWMVKARAVAQAQFVSGHRFKGTLIPSIEAIRAYSVEGAEPEPVVPFPESVPDVVKSLYRGVNGIVSPYSGFDASGWPQDLSGWNGEEASLPELVLQANASVVIEVGSWKGMSSVAIGKALQEVQQKGRLPAGVASPLLLCVDTWQGAPEFLENRLYGVDADRDMLTLHGWPLVFFQWLANMVHAGLTSVVFPLPASSLIAAEFLRRADGGFRADAIYIDGS